MKRLPENSQLLSFQVIEIEWFYLLSVIHYSLNRIRYLGAILTFTPGSPSGVPVNITPPFSRAF
jgi:hypothetical protein